MITLHLAPPMQPAIEYDTLKRGQVDKDTVLLYYIGRAYKGQKHARGST